MCVGMAGAVNKENDLDSEELADGIDVRKGIKVRGYEGIAWGDTDTLAICIQLPSNTIHSK